ncbi:hypothetical protein AVEN_129671-1 [Araneus ventricosus]|uniref:Uncharacterized protein n=1 Tax=Araneus ventricosus TaxID=182803 RepID=A0A4Y2M751_ARAVE|nr:hypothetical protein AVEN_129671-1 [Araneus ventricosus]
MSYDRGNKSRSCDLHQVKERAVGIGAIVMNVIRPKIITPPCLSIQLTLMTIWTQRTSIMKNAPFAVSKDKWNWDSNASCASSGPIPLVQTGTKSKTMAVRSL